MKPISLVVFVLCAATVCSAGKVRAEDVAPQTQNVAQTQEARIELRNIKPRIMAYWLDPSEKITSVIRMPEPPVETTPKVSAPGFLPPGVRVLPSKFVEPKVPLQVDASLVVLPDGIEKIIADDTQNTITIRGTAEGIQKARELVAFLDKPIPQMSVELQLVRLPKALLPRGTAKIASSNRDITASDGAAIEKLIVSGQAKVINASRVSTINKMAAMLRSSSSQTVYATPLDDAETSKRPFVLSVGQNSLVVPTIQRDGTISLAIDFLDGFFQINDNSMEVTPFGSPSNRTVKTVVVVKSNQTICLLNAKQQGDGDNAWVLLAKASVVLRPE